MTFKEIKLEDLIFDLKMKEKEIEISNKYLNHLDYMKDKLDKLINDIFEEQRNMISGFESKAETEREKLKFEILMKEQLK